MANRSGRRPATSFFTLILFDLLNRQQALASRAELGADADNDQHP